MKNKNIYNNGTLLHKYLFFNRKKDEKPHKFPMSCNRKIQSKQTWKHHKIAQ